jgi:hypothetical protein
VSRDSNYRKDGKSLLNIKKFYKHPILIDRRYSSSSSDDNERKHPAAPPAPKISMNFNRPNASLKLQAAKGIQIKLASQPKPAPLVQKTKISSVFNADDSDSEEEMPPEAKMRMKNIGKDTPTSSGPNSFGKTKQGNFLILGLIFNLYLNEAF